MLLKKILDEALRRWPGIALFATTTDPNYIALFREAQLLASAGHPVPALENFFFFEGVLVSRDVRDPRTVFADLTNQLKETPHAS